MNSNTNNRHVVQRSLRVFLWMLGQGSGGTENIK